MDQRPGYASTKDAQLTRARRIGGQVRDLQRQVEFDTYGTAAPAQVSAVTNAPLARPVRS